MPAEHRPACVAEQFILAAMERLAALCLIGSLLASVGLTGGTHLSSPGVSCQPTSSMVEMDCCMLPAIDFAVFDCPQELPASLAQARVSAWHPEA